MDKAGDILKSFLSQYHLGKGEKYVSLFAGWRGIVGEDIASHTRLTDIRHGALLVEVDHPGWMQLLQMNQGPILKAVGKKYPELGIRLLHMRLVRDGAFSEVSKDLPRPEKKAAIPREAESVPVSETPAAGNRGLDHIQDEDLKKLLSRLGKSIREKNRVLRRSDPSDPSSLSS